MAALFDSALNAVSGSPWTYALILAVCAGDAVFPAFPSETIVITGAVLASQGRLEIILVVLSAFAGALLGDNAAYGLGRTGLRKLTDRLMGSPKNQERLKWARDQLERRGAWLIIVARFIPGGRTVTTYTAGTLDMPYKTRFLPADAAAAAVWSAYASALGYFGGSAFENNLWLPLLIATGASLLVAGGGELFRRKVLDRPRESSADPNQP